ncbi:MAG TPA: fumarylacetoacetate hydrolase family protein [Vicinamibacterales bacterium]|nr:fumarylacetoacetate hydrolase family protein [Vicinamibacterales bacterium]
MKLVRFSFGSEPPRLGVIRGDEVADLRASYAASLLKRGVLDAGDRAAALFPSSTRAFLQAVGRPLDAISQITEWVARPQSAVRLHAPIADPGKIICIGLNYSDHAAETNQPLPKEPPIFAKWTNAILDPHGTVLRPRGCQQLDWEVELAVIIGRTARFVPPEEALDHVFGYTVLNDVSARDFQFITSQWGLGKAADTFAPMGPCIADRSEVPDPHRLSLRTWVNDRLMQDGHTSKLVFDVRYLVSFLSGIFTLSPGDVISTGTPPGVGAGHKPPVFLRPGDVCRMEIESIGTIENTIGEA